MIRTNGFQKTNEPEKYRLTHDLIDPIASKQKYRMLSVVKWQSVRNHLFASYLAKIVIVEMSGTLKSKRRGNS